MNSILSHLTVLLATSLLATASPDAARCGKQQGERDARPDREQRDARRDREQRDGRRDREQRDGRRSDPQRGAPGARRGRDHAAMMMRKLDTDRSGGISYEEFSTSDKMAALPEDGRRRIFDHLDKNGDGQIRRKELPGMGEGPRGWDPNGDGRISRKEFLADPRLAKMPLERRKALFRRMDRDGNGVLTREDWPVRPDGSRGPQHHPPFLDPRILAELDRDRDGGLSFDEWRKHPRLGEIGEERLRAMFQRLDRNHDGKLDPGDWQKKGPRPGDKPHAKRPHHPKGAPDRDRSRRKGGADQNQPPTSTRTPPERAVDVGTH